jgi:NADPH-dependent 2,4-dienoyl-CoA reductase/sulfur reductase-like enzyme
MRTFHYKYVILGGGLTAGYAAQEFVKQGIQEGGLCIVSAEDTLPYERPPLSKSFLAGEKTTPDILINKPAFYTDHGIEVMLNTLVKNVNLEEKKLYADDEVIAFEKLLIATGSRPRTFSLPGSNMSNIFYLRRVEDAREIRKTATTAQEAVVIGGGFIAMETTSVLQSQGVHTTMIFPEERVWQSFLTPIMAAFFENYYRDRGVTIMPRQEINSFVSERQSLQVITKSGLSLPADMVIAGIGAIPNDEPFKNSGLKLADDGIEVNRFLETNMPEVWAAGDITRYQDVVYKRPLHIEHWDNAVAQGQHAARVMLGQYQPFEHVPYFFSDIFDLSYELWGDPTGATEIVYRGEVENGRFSAWWLNEDDQLLAAFIMDCPEEERELAPEWIKSGKKLDPRWLQEAELLHSKKRIEEPLGILN